MRSNEVHEEIYDNSPEMWTVDLPRRGGVGTGRPTDTVKLCELGRHIAGKCDALLSRGMKAHEEFAFQAGALKGLELIDGPTSKRLDQFVEGMAASGDQRAYFKQVRAFLYNLKPERRKQ